MMSYAVPLVGAGAGGRGAVVALILALSGCGAEGGTDPGPEPADTLPSAPAIQIALSVSSIAVTQGQQATVTLTITRTNFTGPISVVLTIAHDGLTAVSNPAAVTGDAADLTVSAAGFTEPGTTEVTIVASGAGVTTRSAELAVTVHQGPLNVSSAEELRAEPGQVWRFRGSQIGSLAVTIDGESATVTVEGDSVAIVAVPALAVFQPCLAPDTLPVFLATATGSAHEDVPAEAPLAPALAPGAHTALDDALRRDCRIMLPAGSYAMVAAVPDRQDYAVAAQARADSAQLLLDLLPAAAASVPAGVRQRIVMPTAGVPTRQSMRWHDRPLPLNTPGLATASDAECRLLTGVGDSIEIPTRRDAAGRFRWSSATDPAEWWHLVARTPNVDFVVDTGGRRVWEDDASIRATVGQILTLYDTAFVPLWAELYDTPLPDRDANGRMIWFAPWNSGEVGGGGIGTYVQSGCPDNTRDGENFYAPLDFYSSDPVRTPTYLAAYYREVVLHEASHTHDLSRRAAVHGRWFLWPPGTQIASEGIAVFVPEYWNLKRSGPPLTANQTSVAPVTDGLVHPGNLWEVFPRIAGNYHWDTWLANSGYPQSGRFILWTVAQAVRQGRPLSHALSAMSPALRATYGQIYRAATGATLSDRDVLVAWVLSWYADDRVAGIDPLLDYTPWNTMNAYATQGSPFPLPVASLTSTGSWSVALGDPDDKVVEVTAAETMRLRARATGAIGSRVVLQMLRVQ